MIGEKNGLEAVKEVRDGKLPWLSIRDSKGKWHWAEATLEGDVLRVSCEGVNHPSGIRYAYTTNPEGLRLYNKEGLLASPFCDDAMLP